MKNIHTPELALAAITGKHFQMATDKIRDALNEPGDWTDTERMQWVRGIMDALTIAGATRA